MPVGLGGAAFMRNLPSSNYVSNVEMFNRETEQNEVPLGPVSWPGLGGAKQDIRLPNNGLLTGINLLFKGQLVTSAGTGSVTSTYQWPWNLLKRVQLSANGQTSLISSEGLDMRARRQRMYRNPREELSVAIGTDTVGTVAQTGAAGNSQPGVIATGTYQLTLEWDLPIVHDDESLTGALFAQSDQNYLQASFTPAQSSDLFTLTGTASAAVTGTVYPSVRFYDIPIVGNGQQVASIIPDLSWLHGFLSADNPFTNTGTVKTPLIRTDGQLLALMFYLDNGGALLSHTALSEVRMAYGGNRKPLVYNPVEKLLRHNVANYGGLVKPFAVLDFEVTNPARDLVYPKGVSELLIECEVPSTTVVNSSARVHFVEDTLFAGV